MKISFIQDMFNDKLQTVYIDSTEAGTIENRGEYFLATTPSKQVQFKTASESRAIEALINRASTKQKVLNQSSLF